jgi:hypothetical protein
MSQLKMLERDQKFNVDEFNKKFEESDLINKDIPQQNIINKEIKQEIKQELEENIIMLKNLFFEILELLVDFKNPIPYILANERREFNFAIIILLIGLLLLFFSNLLI